MGLIVRILHGIDSGFEGNLVGRMVLLLSIHRQQAHRSMRRPAISSVIEHATKRHLYQSKALDLLFQSMQVLIGMVERSTDGNGKQGGVAIVESFKASESNFPSLR